jgi:hypothetical protein
MLNEGGGAGVGSAGVVRAVAGAGGAISGKVAREGIGGMYDAVPPFVKGVVLMNIASLLFGSNQVVIKQVVESGLDNFSQLFLRFGFAIIPLSPWWGSAR